MHVGRAERAREGDLDAARAAGAPVVSAYAPSPTSASSTQLASTAIAVFSRRPQRSGSDSRRDCSNMIIAARRLLARSDQTTVSEPAVSGRPHGVDPDQLAPESPPSSAGYCSGLNESAAELMQ